MNDFTDPRQAGARCDVCPLNDKKPALPTGPLDAALVIVGEGPGKLENIKGEVFVGPSGAKLSELLFKHRVARSQVRVTNTILCRQEVPGIEGKRRYDMKTYVAWFRKQNAMRKKQGFEVQPSPFECCRPRLEWELSWLEYHAKKRGAPNGIVIQPLGNFALAASAAWLGVEGKVGGVMKYRGSILEGR